MHSKDSAVSFYHIRRQLIQKSCFIVVPYNSFCLIAYMCLMKFMCAIISFSYIELHIRSTICSADESLSPPSCLSNFILRSWNLLHRTTLCIAVAMYCSVSFSFCISSCLSSSDRQRWHKRWLRIALDLPKRCVRTNRLDVPERFLANILAAE